MRQRPAGTAPPCEMPHTSYWRVWANRDLRPRGHGGCPAALMPATGCRHPRVRARRAEGNHATRIRRALYGSLPVPHPLGTRLVISDRPGERLEQLRFAPELLSAGFEAHFC